MLDAALSSAIAAAVGRATLVANHVIAAEPEAVARLVPHAGRHLTLHLDGWPAALPRLPVLRFAVTRAGLLDWCGDEEGPVDLAIHVDASNPAALAARWAAGRRPRIEVDGDAQLAADVDWIVEHLRWDVEDDLARAVGPTAAHGLARAGATLADGLRRTAGAVLRLTGAAADDRPGAGPGAR